MMKRASIIFLLLLLSGCSAEPVNPSFPLTYTEARSALRDMRSDPRPLPRPLVIVGGYLDPNVSPAYLKCQFQCLTGDDRIVTVVVGFCRTFEEARDKVIRAVDERFPSDDPHLTTEVDVIGASLGGLVARYAAAPSRDPGNTRRLNINRLFSISSPHRGARAADFVTLTTFQHDLRPNSNLVQHLQLHDCATSYTHHPYTLLHDHCVGEHYSTPPGQHPHWLPNPIPWLPYAGHFSAWFDPRILADISRRLRDETPFSTATRTPLPN